MELLSLLFILFLFYFRVAYHIRLVIDCALEVRTELLRRQSRFNSRTQLATRASHFGQL